MGRPHVRGSLAALLALAVIALVGLVTFLGSSPAQTGLLQNAPPGSKGTPQFIEVPEVGKDGKKHMQLMEKILLKAATHKASGGAAILKAQTQKERSLFAHPSHSAGVKKRTVAVQPDFKKRTVAAPAHAAKMTTGQKTFMGALTKLDIGQRTMAKLARAMRGSKLKKFLQALGIARHKAKKHSRRRADLAARGVTALTKVAVERGIMNKKESDRESRSAMNNYFAHAASSRAHHQEEAIHVHAYDTSTHKEGSTAATSDMNRCPQALTPKHLTPPPPKPNLNPRLRNPRAPKPLNTCAHGQLLRRPEEQVDAQDVEARGPGGGPRRALCRGMVPSTLKYKHYTLHPKLQTQTFNPQP